MVTKTKMLGLILAAAIVSTMPMFVYADSAAVAEDSSHQNMGWHHGQDHHMMAKVLNLSEDQQKQLKDLWKQQKDSMKSVFEQMKTNREAFNTEIVKATPDMNKINDIQTQLKAIQSQMADNHLNSLLAIKKIMTPEQFAGFMALKKEKELKMHGHHKGDMKWGQRKDGQEYKHGGDKDDNDHDSDAQ